RQGRAGLLGWFVGQVMKETGGRANPQLVQRLLRERLETSATPAR
ncbi:MAG TPA: GatB/YqeY domain-containing protein, partial [Thermoanaerobaculia bacterium]|nr:GatB/YqeY domain-containing protein [Thermoanaerobaculia bacterium]